jgi:pyruvate/2-oxoglutarate dehydrogenase complex dihydrolipoamide dehydrogenase (E3) component
MTYAVFVDPPYARVGMSESEVRKDGRRALIATMPMSRVGRARERGETDGFMKALVDANTKQILGAAIHGIEGDEAIHTFVDIMNAGAPYATLKNAMHIHPTVSELIPTLLGMLEPLK